MIQSSAWRSTQLARVFKNRLPVRFRIPSSLPNRSLSRMASTVPEPEIGQEITFLTATHCPYAQRSWIALNAKGVKYSTVSIDLKNKPDWFFKYNPLGRVPTLVYKDDEGIQSLYESLIVNEFIHELPGTPLLPSHPAQRARARIIIDRFGSGAAGAFGAIMYSKDSDSIPAKLEKLYSELSWLESELSETGPYFLGSEFSLVDAAVIPWFLRIPVFEEIVEGVNLLEKYPKLAKWYHFTKEQPAVTGSFATTKPDVRYEEDLKTAYVAHIKSIRGD